MSYAREPGYTWYFQLPSNCEDKELMVCADLDIIAHAVSTSAKKKKIVEKLSANKAWYPH